MAKRKKTSKKLEFSKIITIITLVIYILTWLVSWCVWIFTKEIPQQMINYITAPFMVVISGYFAKSGVENFNKINQSQDDEDNYNIHSNK